MAKEKRNIRIQCDALEVLKNCGDGVRRAGTYIREDIKAVRERDPAATSDLEVALLYSGFHALEAHRLAYLLHKKGFRLTARAISQAAKFLTGIEIHPGAEIGRRFFIDHGAGVVIGETAIIGDDCTVYQGVTLGGTGKDTGKRHPTLGNNVMVGCGAKILGPFRIGDHTKIAAGAVVLEEIPADSTAVGIPARVVRTGGKKIETDLDQVHIPDPVANQMQALEARIASLEKALEKTLEDAAALRCAADETVKADTAPVHTDREAKDEAETIVAENAASPAEEPGTVPMDAILSDEEIRRIVDETEQSLGTH